MLLFHGLDSTRPGAGWQSSDRPPLQSAWQLLAWAPLRQLGYNETTLSCAASLLFQLLWIPAVYSLFRLLGANDSLSMVGVASIGFSGFFLLNSVYTWPKMAAGAFTLASFGSLVFPALRRGFRSKPVEIAAASWFGSMALLSHSGAAFALLPIAAFAVFAIGFKFSYWKYAVIPVALCVLPWLAYQRFYDPPGNRLLKWHLAGQIEADERSFYDTIKASYAKAPSGYVVEKTFDNLKLQFGERWREVFRIADADARRKAEFFSVLRSGGVWTMSLLPVFLIVLFMRKRGVIRSLGRIGVVWIWMLVTTVVWSVLLFKAEAVLHHGSYAIPMCLFVTAVVMTANCGRTFLYGVALIHLATFSRTWLASSQSLAAGVNYWAVSWASLCSVALMVYLFFRKRDVGIGPKRMAPEWQER